MRPSQGQATSSVAPSPGSENGLSLRTLLPSHEMSAINTCIFRVVHLLRSPVANAAIAPPWKTRISWMFVAGLLARSIVVPGDLLRTCQVNAVPSRSAPRWVHCNVSDCQFRPIQAGIHTPGRNAVIPRGGFRENCADRDFRCWGRKCLINLCGSGTNPSLPHRKISLRRYCLVHLLRWYHRHRSRLILCVASLQTAQSRSLNDVSAKFYVGPSARRLFTHFCRWSPSMVNQFWSSLSV